MKFSMWRIIVLAYSAMKWPFDLVKMEKIMIRIVKASPMYCKPLNGSVL